MGRRSFVVLILAFVTGCESGGVPAGPADELEKLKGTWTGPVLLGDVPGKGDVTLKCTSSTVTISGKGVTGKDYSISHPYTIDPTKKPKWIDFKGDPKSDPPYPTTYGIYELDGDKLKICMGTHATRPDKFGGGYGTVTAYYRLTRK